MAFDNLNTDSLGWKVNNLIRVLVEVQMCTEVCMSAEEQNGDKLEITDRAYTITDCHK